MSNDENEQLIRDYNFQKLKKNKTIIDLEPDDKVRIKIKGMFKKSSEPQFSDEIYKVASVNNRTIILSNGQIVKRQNLLKVPKLTISKQTNVISQNNKIARKEKILKQEGIDETNIVTTKRTKKNNSKYIN
jgi:hypothetical protein